MCQILFKGICKRIEANDKPTIPIISELYKVSVYLENVFDGFDSKIPEMEQELESMYEFYENRFIGLIDIFERDLQNNNAEINEAFSLSLDFERKYFDYSESISDYNVVNYLRYAPNYDIQDSLQKTIQHLVKEYVRNTYSASVVHDQNFQGINYPYPPPKLAVLKSDGKDPYEESRTLWKAIMDSQKDSQKDSKNEEALKEIGKDLDKELDLSKLIQHPPNQIYSRLNDILVSGSYEKIMKDQISANLPKLVPKKDSSEKEALVEIFAKTQELRGSIGVISRMLEDEIHALNKMEIHDSTQNISAKMRPKLESIRNDFDDKVRNCVEVSSGEYEANSILNRLDMFKRKRDKSTHGIDLDESVLWIGLGQGGGQILRECLMYCLDNLSDERAMSLLYALGIRDDYDVISDNLSKLNDPQADSNLAGETLKNLFANELHVLAMNLGPELGELVDPSKNPKSCFFWGKESEESNYDVLRYTTNTLCLDQRPGGAGGATGIGRGFAFARKNQIAKVINEVASKGGRAPRQVVITHSLAGGSGSGMVLPVLQFVRGLFPADTIIWVMSVGIDLNADHQGSTTPHSSSVIYCSRLMMEFTYRFGQLMISNGYHTPRG